jgi:hypothetical protein
MGLPSEWGTGEKFSNSKILIVFNLISYFVLKELFSKSSFDGGPGAAPPAGVWGASPPKAAVTFCRGRYGR